MLLPRYLKYSRLFFRQRGSFPVYLIFFVTARCDCRCDHCFYWQHTNTDKKELDLDEIDRIAASMGELLQVTLTGGDAALREDLDQIAAIFARRNKVANFSIGTNGSQTGLIQRHIENMLPWLTESGANLTIDLSLDGLADDHDRIRHHPHLFDKVVATAKMVKEMKKHWSGINLCIDTTVSALNDTKLRPLYEFIRDEIKPDIANALLIRGNPRDPRSKDVSLEAYADICRWLEEDVRAGLFPGYSFAPAILNVKDILLRRLILKTARTQQYQVPCTAALLTGVIYPEGDVAACELLDDRLGNLREVDYDMKRIWRGVQAERLRKHIRQSRCYCIHQCFLSNNILFNPRFLPAFIREYSQMVRHR